MHDNEPQTVFDLPTQSSDFKPTKNQWNKVKILKLPKNYKITGQKKIFFYNF